MEGVRTVSGGERGFYPFLFYFVFGVTPSVKRIVGVFVFVLFLYTFGVTSSNSQGSLLLALALH